MKHEAKENFDGVLIGKYFAEGEYVPELKTTAPEGGWVDGGDTCQRVGMYYFGLKMLEDLDDEALFNFLVNNELEIGTNGHYIAALLTLNENGVYKRHPDRRFWYSSTETMSRDQCAPLVLSMAARGFKTQLKEFFMAHLRRGLLFTTNTRKNGSTAANHGEKFRSNARDLTEFEEFVRDYRIPLYPLPDGYRNYSWKLPDFTGPSFWSIYIRGLDLWYLYPLLLIFDLEFVLGSYLTSKSNHIDALKHTMECIYFDQKYPTPWVKLANKYINSSTNLLSKMHAYFNKQGEPWFIFRLYAPIVKKILG